jgi:LysM repeat protein
MKKLFSLLFLLPLFAAAQDKIINHTVAPKESYSSIGRLYNINGRELANYNKLEYEKGLSIGQVLKVPVKNGTTVVVAPPVVKTETVVIPKATATKSGEAIYHTVAAKETLYGVSKKYSVTVADIKKWNNLTVDGLSEGAKIIVGYGNATSEAVTIVKKEKEIVPEEVKKAPIETPKVIEVKKIEPAKEVKPVATPAVVKNIGNGFNGGFFKTSFDAKGGWEASKETGNAAVFKSSSGWDDGKYYCLHNTAVQGSIVKITNNTNGKIVYAKVLDVIPDIKQNAGIILRISNAAAAELGVGENQFDCTINYSK